MLPVQHVKNREPATLPIRRRIGQVTDYASPPEKDASMSDESKQWCTYRQSLDFIRVHCDFLAAAEKAAILGGNAVRLFGVEPAAPRS